MLKYDILFIKEASRIKVGRSLFTYFAKVIIYIPFLFMYQRYLLHLTPFFVNTISWFVSLAALILQGNKIDHPFDLGKSNVSEIIPG